MNELSVNLIDTLVRIRNQAVAMSKGSWSELETLIDSILPDPLNPIALLPIATGKAVGGKLDELIHVAAAVVLIDGSLRIIDDCADKDNPDALYESIGVGRSVNYAMALNTIATRELWRSSLSSDMVKGLLNNYFCSFLQVCQGQDFDINKRINSLPEYQEIVKLKTVAAYEFAAVVGARIACSESNAIALCSNCGAHLGWMTQILDDIEALWFPITENSLEIEKLSFPILLGLTINHSNAHLLEKLCHEKEFDRIQICKLLDEMKVRTRLMNLALDHRDKAIESLSGSLNPEGSQILKIWLDWLLRDGARLLKNTY
ncbi:polyprenyl synthetase family protein [Trichocoleus sp. DQ-U1]|uniref:polyprenyl synthetase family protein n=1 Tax=Trichocoleus sp. DQ-U1 TaxID=2933926 RepID=UPI003296AC76